MGPKMEIRGIAEVGVVECVESPEGLQGGDVNRLCTPEFWELRLSRPEPRRRPGGPLEREQWVVDRRSCCLGSAVCVVLLSLHGFSILKMSKPAQALGIIVYFCQ